jgi:hypothetical protein
MPGRSASSMAAYRSAGYGSGRSLDYAAGIAGARHRDLDCGWEVTTTRRSPATTTAAGRRQPLTTALPQPFCRVPRLQKDSRCGTYRTNDRAFSQMLIGTVLGVWALSTHSGRRFDADVWSPNGAARQTRSACGVAEGRAEGLPASSALGTAPSLLALGSACDGEGL